MVRVFIFFFVTALGMTMSVDVTFSHRNESASLQRAAVNRQVATAALMMGLSSAERASSCSVLRVDACPARFVFGIARFVSCTELRLALFHRRASRSRPRWWLTECLTISTYLWANQPPRHSLPSTIVSMFLCSRGEEDGPLKAQDVPHPHLTPLSFDRLPL